MNNYKQKFFTAVSIAFLSFMANSINAEEIIRYSENGSILGRYDCDKTTVVESASQDTIVCAKKPKIAIKLDLRRIFNNRDYENCNRDRNCVLIANNRDENWPTLALYGIPDATFGRYENGRSCAQIQESVPRSTTWARDTWQLCTNNPNIELAYTYAYGHSNEGLNKRFKAPSVQRVCFGNVLRGYVNQQYWTDNCIFVRQK